MKINKLRYIRLVLSLLVILFLGACSKTEFLPEPEGEKIPFQNDATQTVEQLLAASSAKLYYSAWQKSNIKNIIAANGNKVLYTVFVPSDAAMQAAGLGANEINQMPVATLDSLMMFYTTIGAVTKDELKLRSDNFMVKSLLFRKDLFVKFYESNLDNQQRYDLYHYRHYVAIKDDQLLVNGKAMGKLNYQPATNGGIYLMEKAIPKPTKTIIEALEADGRFTMFLESQRIADDLYLNKIGDDIELMFGFRPEPQEIMSDFAYERLYYKKNWEVNKISYGGPNIAISTLFAPTDEAFHKAGFQSVADIIKFNERSLSSIRFDDNTFAAVGGFPMDTIYNFHREFGRMFQPLAPGGDKTLSNATVFYSNVLNSTLNEYLVSAGGNPTIDYAYKMPFAFTSSGNVIQLKVKNSEQPAATVIEGDLNTLNGPIHVVDQLLIPKGFKLK